MSNVSSMHDVRAYTGNEKALTDQRLVTVSFKTPKDAPIDFVKPANVCVSIPLIAVQVNPAELQQAMQEQLENLQDSLIRSLYIASCEAKAPLKQITDSQIGYAALKAFAEQEAMSKRLTKDAISVWFDSSVSSDLMLALANAMKIPNNPDAEQSAKLEKALTQYKELVTSLASPKASIAPKIAEQMEKAIVLAPEGDRMRGLLLQKVQGFKTEKVVELLANL